MGRIYYALLKAIEWNQFHVFERRLRVPTTRKLLIAFGCWAWSRLA